MPKLIYKSILQALRKKKKKKKRKRKRKKKESFLKFDNIRMNTQLFLYFFSFLLFFYSFFSFFLLIFVYDSTQQKKIDESDEGEIE